MADPSTAAFWGNEETLLYGCINAVDTYPHVGDWRLLYRQTGSPKLVAQ